MNNKLHRTDYPGNDLQTLKYWKKKHLVPKDNEYPLRLWCNPHHQNAADYYTREQMREMTQDELEIQREENRRKRQIARERKKKLEQEERLEEIEYYKEEAKRQAYDAVYKACMPLAKELLSSASTLPSVPCNNTSGIVVFDTETTGLSSMYDEILQLSIIDGDGNVLLNEYVKPYWSNEWEEAHKINGITPSMVKDSLYPHQLLPKVKGIFEAADTIIAYNIPFDKAFLEKWGIDFSGKSLIDVMQYFAPVYGEWNEYEQDYKWKSLSTCANFFGYEFKAHDSLEDAKATLFCYNKIKELNEKEID